MSCFSAFHIALTIYPDGFYLLIWIEYSLYAYNYTHNCTELKYFNLNKKFRKQIKTQKNLQSDLQIKFIPMLILIIRLTFSTCFHGYALQNQADISYPSLPMLTEKLNREPEDIFLGAIIIHASHPPYNVCSSWRPLPCICFGGGSAARLWAFLIQIRFFLNFHLCMILSPDNVDTRILNLYFFCLWKKME